MKNPIRFRPHLRTLLLTVNVVVMLLPLAAVYTLHLYENELIRQTESGLISQGAVLAASCKQAILQAARANNNDIPPGIPIAADSPFQEQPQKRYIPITA